MVNCVWEAWWLEYGATGEDCSVGWNGICVSVICASVVGEGAFVLQAGVTRVECWIIFDECFEEVAAYTVYGDVEDVCDFGCLDRGVRAEGECENQNESSGIFHGVIFPLASSLTD